MDELFSQRLTELIKTTDCNLNDIEIAIGKKAATISRYASGEIKGVKRSTIVKLSNFFGVNPAWLAGLSDEKHVNSLDSKSYQLLNYYNQLNKLGKDKALENVKDLTEIPKYTEKKTGLQDA